MEARGQHSVTEDGGSAALLWAETLSRPASEDHSPMRQQYSQMTVQDSARLHAGNSYVGNQHNYWAPSPPQATQYSASISLQGALAFPEMNLRSANIAREQAQTCEWLLKTPEYKRWRNPALWPVHRGVLWVRGKPGAGKSTVMKYAIKKHREDTKRQGKLISFFFSARGKTDLEKSTEGMYRALLYQIVEEVPQLEDMVDMNARRTYNKQGWPLELLKEMFREAMLCYGRKNTLTCYIDALDECDEDEIRDMLSMIEDIGDEAISSGTGPMICLASRHYPNIRVNHLEEILLDDLVGHQGDIALYVQRKLRLNDVDHKVGLAEEISRRSSGVFLWVVLVVAILNKTSDHGDIHRLRDRMLAVPTNLRELFDDILDRDESNGKLVPMIQWTLYAGRRLTALELYFAVMISTNQMEVAAAVWDRKLVNRKVLSDFILTGSKGFFEMAIIPLELDGSPEELRYEFIHESVREYFLYGGLQKLEPGLRDDISGLSHERLAKSCATYITHLSTELSNQEMPWKILHCYPFLSYVRDFGGFYHAEEAERKAHCQDTFCAGFPLDEWLLFQITSESCSETVLQFAEHHATLLFILLYQGYPNLAQREMQRRMGHGSLTTRSDINDRCGPLGSASKIALDRDYTEIIRLLIGSAVHDTELWNEILPHAVERDDTDTVRALLATKVSCSARYDSVCNALNAASRGKNAEIVSLLIASRAVMSNDLNISHQYDSSETPLHISVTSGHAEIVRILIDNGFDVNIKCGPKPERLLQLAVARRDVNIIRMLLENGADVNARGYFSGERKTALHTAVFTKEQEIICILLDHGADINAVGSSRPAVSGIETSSTDLQTTGLAPTIDLSLAAFGTALHLAAASGSFEITALLLSKGADLGRRGWRNQTLLHTAVRSENRNIAILRLLLERGMNTGAWSAQDFGNVLVATVKSSHDEQDTLQAFADYGVLEKVSQDYFFTVLDIAARLWRNLDFARLLLQHLPTTAFTTPEYDGLIHTTHAIQYWSFKELLEREKKERLDI